MTPLQSRIPTRVVHVRMGSSAVGGPERSIATLAPALAARGVTSSVAILDDGRTDWRRFESVFAAAHIELHRLPLRHRLDLGAVRALGALARRVGASILHTHDYKSDVYAALLARGGLAWVTTAHGDVVATRRLRLYHALSHLLTRRADGATAPHAGMLERFRGDPRARVISNVTVVPDTAVKAPTLPRTRIVTVARLSPEKGIDILLEGLARIPVEVPLAVTVVGDGPSGPALRGLAEARGVAARVSWAGWCDSVDTALDQADMLVLPSRSEGQPLAMLEAMARGLPVVATRVGGVVHCVEDGRTGLLVTAGDAAALAAAVLRAVRGTFDADAARGHVLAEHAPTVVAARLAAVYAAAERRGDPRRIR